MGRAQHTFTTAITTSVVIFSAATAAESGAESRHCPTHTHLLLLQLGDLLLYHGDLAVHPIHILDQLLLGEPWRYQLQLRISMWGTGRRHRLQLACQAAVLWWRKNRCGISAGGTPHPPKNHKFPAMTSGTNTPGVCRASPHVPNTGLFTDPSSLSLPSLVLLPGVPSPAFSKVQILFILLHASFPNRPSSREALPLSFPHNTPLSYPTYPVCALPPDQTPREPRPTTSRLMLHGH